MQIKWRTVRKPRFRDGRILSVGYEIRLPGESVEYLYDVTRHAQIFAVLQRSMDRVQFGEIGADPPQLQGRHGKDIVCAVEWKTELPAFRILLAPPRSLSVQIFQYSIGFPEVMLVELDRIELVGHFDRSAAAAEFDHRVSAGAAALLIAALITLELRWNEDRSAI